MHVLEFREKNLVLSTILIQEAMLIAANTAELSLHSWSQRTVNAISLPCHQMPMQAVPESPGPLHQNSTHLVLRLIIFVHSINSMNFSKPKFSKTEVNLP